MFPPWAEEWVACVFIGYRKCGFYLPSFAQPTPIRNTILTFADVDWVSKQHNARSWKRTKNTFVSLSENACQNPFQISRGTFAFIVVYFTKFHKPGAERSFACRERKLISGKRTEKSRNVGTSSVTRLWFTEVTIGSIFLDSQSPGLSFTSPSRHWPKR